MTVLNLKFTTTVMDGYLHSSNDSINHILFQHTDYTNNHAKKKKKKNYLFCCDNNQLFGYIDFESYME